MSDIPIVANLVLVTSLGRALIKNGSVSKSEIIAELQFHLDKLTHEEMKLEVARMIRAVELW